MNELKNDFQKKTSEAETLRLNLEKTNGTLSRSKSLISGLKEERDKWYLQQKQTTEQFKSLSSHCATSSAHITYNNNTLNYKVIITLYYLKIIIFNRIYLKMK